MSDTFSTPDSRDFERAIAAYELGGIDVPGGVEAVGRASLDTTGLFLVGEAHGVEQTPRAVFALAHALDVDAIGFEWSWDQFDPVVQPVVAGGRVDRDALWSLPPDAEAFSGDGRFTAGHVRLLEELAPGLVQVLCVDRLVSDSRQAREQDMAARLLGERREGCRMLAVLGGAHVARVPTDGVEPAGAILARRLPGLRSCLIAADGGTVWYHGERPLRRPTHTFDVDLPVGPARPATVPVHVHM